MVYVVRGIVRDIRVEGEQIRFTFDGSEDQLAAKDFDPTIREGDWARIMGGDNSLEPLLPGEQRVPLSFRKITRLRPPVSTVSLSWSDPGSGAPRTQRVTLPTTIGRGSGATVRLINPEISREHARLIGGFEGISVVDSSANGTLVNGQQVQHSAFVRDGETVQIGPYRLTIDTRPAPDAPPTVPPVPQWGPPPAPAQPQPVRRSAAEQTAVRAAGKQIGGALLLMLLMVVLAIVVIAIVGAGAHAGSSTLVVPVGGGIVIFVGFFRALLLLIVGLRNLGVALARRPR